MGRECVDMGKQEDAQLLGGTAIKPKGWDRKGMEAFKYLLYNPETGEILTRTPLSWLKIIVFYINYYSKQYNNNQYEDHSPLQLCSENMLRQPGDSACKFDFSTLKECANFPHGFVNNGENNVEP